MARRGNKKGRAVSGWLILDKPEDVGSTEAVSKVKWLFKAQKAGHAGTLDPLASGMLPIALGEATKTVPYVMDGRKVYEFTVAWGEERTTDDLEGDISRISDARPERDAVEAILSDYTGTIEQTPPRFSAVKIQGNRAYDLAREGEVVDVPSRTVEIHRLSLIATPSPHEAVFVVECGKGTYVRSLARDFGRQLGCFGHVSSLRRTAVAPFADTDMVPLETLIDLQSVEDADERLRRLDGYLVDTGEALANLPHLPVTDDQARRLRLGNAVLLRGHGAPIEAEDAWATAGGQLVAIGSIDAGQFHPRRVFGN